MNHRVLCQAPGAPEVMKWVEAPLPNPAPGEAQIRHTAIGVNYIDVYQRSGVYPIPFPAVLGFEAAGVVLALGSGVAGFTVGQRVACVDGPTGAYSEARNHPADRLVPLPDSISDEAAAALIFKGLTAHMLVRRVWQPVQDSWVLVHAAAGGVGLILTRWLAAVGVHVIGVVSTEEKAGAARSEGAHTVITIPKGGSYKDLSSQVKRITGGTGVRVAYDSVGRDSFEASLDSLATFGLLASYGRSSGAPPAVDITDIGRRGSLAVQRPSVLHHVADPVVLQSAAKEVFEAYDQGLIKAHIYDRIPLRDAARAHRLLESRSTQGALLLIP